MKNTKYVLLGVFIMFIIIFIINIVSSCINSNRTIHIKSYDGYDKTRESLSTKINKVKNTDCKNSLNNMLNRIDDNNISGNIKIKDYYEVFYKDDLTFLDYYQEAVETCNVKNDQIYIKAMSALLYPNQIKEEYNHSYELHVKYKNNSNNISDEIGTYTTILNELGVLSDILGELS